jgi:formate C-acetyltransferase
MTPRTRFLKELLLKKKPMICVERAKYWTEAMKETEGEPMIIRNAKALERVLMNISVNIYPGELIVGTMVSDPPGAIVYPEGIGLRPVALSELETIESRPTNPFRISEDAIKVLKEEVFPYWWDKRTIDAYAKEIMPKKVYDLQYRGAYFILTEIAGISHVAVNYPKLLSLGFEKYQELAKEKIAEYEDLKSARPEDIDKATFYKAAEMVSRAIISFAKRYSEKAKELADVEKDPRRREELIEIAEICGRVPAKPPRSFHEALQFIWLTQVALHQENYEQGISMGRIDQYLLPYYLEDLKSNRINESRALELVECFLIKHNELVPLFDSVVNAYFAGLPTNPSITLGGLKPSGEDATNELTYLFLEAAKNVAMRDPNIHVRLHRNSPEKLVKRLAEVMLSGTNNVAIFNDEVIIKAWLRKGLQVEEARNYSTIGCVELAPFGNSFTSSDAALFNLAKCLELALNNGVDMVLLEKIGVETGDPGKFKSVEDVVEAFRAQLSHLVKAMVIGSNAYERANQVVKPTPLLSLCIEGPFEAGRDITLGSAKYNFTGVQAVGLADVADSLAAIEWAVFRERAVTMDELVEALKANFEGREELRQMLLNKAPKYGNDDDLADRYARLVAQMYSEEVEKYENVRGGSFIAGMYSMTTHIGFGWMTAALPSGRRASEPLSNGASPQSYSMTKGLTAAIMSVSKMDFTRYSNGAALTLTIDPKLFAGPEGVATFASLLKSVIELGVMHTHFNVVDVDVLLEAQKNPEKYRHLVVRVAGYSAYFVDLPKDVQDEIIRRHRRT